MYDALTWDCVYFICIHGDIGERLEVTKDRQDDVDKVGEHAYRKLSFHGIEVFIHFVDVCCAEERVALYMDREWKRMHVRVEVGME